MYAGFGVLAPIGGGVRVSSGDRCAAAAPTEPAGETRSPPPFSPLFLEGKGVGGMGDVNKY